MSTIIRYQKKYQGIYNYHLQAAKIIIKILQNKNFNISPGKSYLRQLSTQQIIGHKQTKAYFCGFNSD
jgi:hypothetical protein